MINTKDVSPFPYLYLSWTSWKLWLAHLTNTYFFLKKGLIYYLNIGIPGWFSSHDSLNNFNQLLLPLYTSKEDMMLYLLTLVSIPLPEKGWDSGKGCKEGGIGYLTYLCQYIQVPDNTADPIAPPFVLYGVDIIELLQLCIDTLLAMKNTHFKSDRPIFKFISTLISSYFFFLTLKWK